MLSGPGGGGPGAPPTQLLVPTRAGPEATAQGRAQPGGACAPRQGVLPRAKLSRCLALALASSFA